MLFQTFAIVIPHALPEDGVTARMRQAQETFFRQNSSKFAHVAEWCDERRCEFKFQMKRQFLVWKSAYDISGVITVRNRTVEIVLELPAQIWQQHREQIARSLRSGAELALQRQP